MPAYRIYTGGRPYGEHAFWNLHAILELAQGQALDNDDAALLALLVYEFEDAPPSVSIPGRDAQHLLPLLESYARRLAAETGPVANPQDAVELDLAAGLVDELTGEHADTPAWRYYAISTLIEACRRSATTRDPIVLMAE